MAPRVNNKSIINVLGFTNYRGTTMVDLFKKVNLNSDILNNVKYYDEYIIKDYDRWDTISNNFYDTPSLYWLILVYNKIKDPFSSLIVGNKIKIIKSNLIQSILIDLRG